MTLDDQAAAPAAPPAAPHGSVPSPPHPDEQLPPARYIVAGDVIAEMARHGNQRLVVLG